MPRSIEVSAMGFSQRIIASVVGAFRGSALYPYPDSFPAWESRLHGLLGGLRPSSNSSVHPGRCPPRSRVHGWPASSRARARIALRQRSRAGRLVVAPDKPSSLEKRLASGPLQGSELQGCTLVVSRYAGIAVFHGLIMALTFDPCKPLKKRGGGRGSKLTLCETLQSLLETPFPIIAKLYGLPFFC